MTKIRIIILGLLVLLICPSLNAQKKKSTTRRNRARTTQVEQKKEEEQKDTVPVAPKPEEPKYKSLDDPMIVRYLRGGYAKEKKLFLVTNSDYDSLTVIQKQSLLNKVSQEFADHDITIFSGDQQRELWIPTATGIQMIERWNNDSLQIEKYLPLELKRQGKTKMFYYVGGLLSGGGGSFNYSLNLRAGTYLYKDLLDASATLNVGGSKANGEGQFNGDIGVDSRAYLPLHSKKVNIAPYGGLGVSWAFAPESYFELRLLAGACWFVGPGSLDIGLQYGIKSKFSATLGYTFRIPTIKKK